MIARHRHNAAQLLLPIGAPPAPPSLVAVWIDGAAWAALDPEAREDLARPRGGLVVVWRQANGIARAEVAAELVPTLAGLADAHGAELHEEGQAAA